jgi:hypothetical protein
MKRLRWGDSLITKIMNRYKLVSIITKEVRDENGAILQQAGLAVRVPKGLAQVQVDRGLAVYTSKGRFKHLLIAQKKKHKREAILRARKKAIEETRIGHKRKPI